MPVGIKCAQISSISNGGVCTNPGDVGQPMFANRATQSAIVWNQAPTDTIDPGNTETLTYLMAIPLGTGVSQDLVNTASVRSFDVDTNIPDSPATYFPANNVDTTVTSDQ